METRSKERGISRSSDMKRLKQLLNNGNSDNKVDRQPPTYWMDQADRQMPSLERATPRSLQINTSMDTTDSSYDEGLTPQLEPASHDIPFNSSTNIDNGRSKENSDPVNDMMNIFCPLTSPKFTPSLKTSKEIGGLQEFEVDETNEVLSPSNEFDPFREIVNMLSPRSAQKTSTESIRTEDDDCSKSESTQPLDPFQKIVSHFSPPASKNLSAIKANKEDDSTPLVNEQGSSKRIRHQEDMQGQYSESDRDVATFGELYHDARKSLANLASAAREVSAKQWLQMIRQIDYHEKIIKTQRTAKRNIEMVINSAKTIDADQVLKSTKASATHMFDTLQNNAHLHPLPWAIIGALTCAIIVHILFFTRSSVGVPSTQYWRFTMNVHESVSFRMSEQIVERVSSALQDEIGDEATFIVEDVVRSSMTCPAISGEEMLIRVTEALKNAEPKMDFFDVLFERFVSIRQNPKLLFSMIAQIWKSSKEHLSSEAFEATTV